MCPQLENLENFNFELITTNQTGEIISRTDGSARYFLEEIGAIRLEMVEIPGGLFTMGSPENEEGRYNYEGPQHQVKVPPFFIGKYQITQEQYQVLMGENPSRFPGRKRPVERVTWIEAGKFCEQLSKKTGKSYTLPSEAQWEYACRAGTITPFHFGGSINTDLANYNGNYTHDSVTKGEWRQQTTEVGIFPPNPFGLYDMHGNVSEWCLDTWHPNYQGAPNDGREWIDESSQYKVIRGGSWLNLSRICRCASRDFNFDYYNDHYGFRVVCNV